MKHWENKSLDDLWEYVRGFGWIKEKWRDLIGYDGYYAVSTFGRVYSYERMVWQPQKGSFVKRKARILSQKKTSDGYLAVTLQVDNIKKYSGVHRLVALMFVKNPKNKPEVNHRFGNKRDNRPAKLEWVTDKENTHHAIKLKLAPSMIGEENSRAILTVQQVLEIQKKYKKIKWGQKGEFAKRFPVGESTIRKIAGGLLWSHIK